MARKEASVSEKFATSRSEATGEIPQTDAGDFLIRQNAELRGLVAEKRQAIAALDAFLGAIGHELRNPMTPLLGKLQLLRRGVHKGLVQPDKIEESLEQIEGLLLHYIKRATTLFDIPRLRGADPELRPAAADLRQIVADVAAGLATLAEQSGSKLECVLPAAAVVGAWDIAALQQILDDLIGNAIKYGESRPIGIRLGWEGNEVMIEVIDRGRGVAAEELMGIFDGFERDSSASGARTGLGVGLWIASRLATAMKGSIGVSSVPLEGSVFTLTLPRNSSEFEA